MMKLLLFSWFSVGCTIQQYGGGTTSAVETAAPTTAVPVDFVRIESRLEAMIAGETENVDRRDRLEAAWDLCQKARKATPESQQVILRYLKRIVHVEERSSDAETDALANPDEQSFVPVAAIAAEQIEPAAIADTPAAKRLAIVPPDAGAADVMASARAYLAAGEFDGALKQLAVCSGQPCSAATVTLRKEVEDRLVYREREAAGARFMAAKNNSDPSQRMREIKAVAASLEALATRYPRSRYAEGVRSSLTTVRKALTEESRQGG
jgi:hypothetical protein